MQPGAFSLSGIREGPVQDNTVACYFTYFNDPYERTPYVFNLSPEDFSITSTRSGSVQDNVIDCIVYADDNDVYFTSVTFE